MNYVEKGFQTNSQIAYDIAPIVNQFYNKLNGILRECGKYIMS